MNLHDKRREENAALDERVLAVIEGGTGMRFCGVCLAIQSRAGSATRREIDRALQRLRKAKRIEYTSLGGWRAAK